MTDSSQGLYTPFSQANLESTHSRPKPTAEKVKPKTRGETTTAEANITPALPPHQQSDNQPTNPLSSRAHKVMKTLFHIPSPSALPGEIAWTDFLFAMTACGFAPEKLYGSVWQFTPLRMDVERSIQFHEPHPKGKIPYRIARRMGRRLARAYGWVGEMFVLGS